MTLRIDCPNCGVRSVDEWIYGEVYDVPDSLSGDQRDIDRAYFHNNEHGEISEAWFHLYGCRRWIRVRRDTRNDTFCEDE